MPYKNIHFVKVKMELLEDHRFLFQLNDRQKGLYLMLLALAGKTNNEIFNDLTFIKGRLAIKELDIEDLETISRFFPKFYLDGNFWKFKNFNEEHNQILTKTFGISQGYPKDMQRMDKNRIDKNRKEKNKISTKPTDDVFLKELESVYPTINLVSEFQKMRGWLLSRHNRKLTKKFAVNWLNRKLENDREIKIENKTLERKHDQVF